MENNNRIVWIDWAKTLLIYLMVVGHCNPNPLHAELFYAFHMPAFFLISGMLLRVHPIFKVLKSLLIPVVFFSIVNAAIFTIPKIIKHSLDINVLYNNWWLQYFTVDSEINICLFGGVWFIFVLLICRLLMTYMVSRKWYIWGGIIICILFVTIENYVEFPVVLKNSYFWRVIPSLPFFLIGFLLQKKMTCVTDLRHQYLYMPILVFIFLGVCLFNGKCDIYSNEYGKSYLLFFVTAIVGSILVFTACSCFKRNSVIEVYSKGTLLILGMNMFFRNISSLIIDKLHLTMVIDDSLIPWLQAMLVILLCYYPIKYILKYKPILLGK